MRRGLFLATSVAVLAAPALSSAADASAARIVVYRDTGCTCCEGWVAAMRSAGYAVELKDIDHEARLRRFAIPEALAGCHTAVANGYLIEGHVPIPAVAKLLRERPKTRGITLPGMPSGTPGMPGPHTTVNVLLLDDPRRVFYME
ncbi:MAG: DUF411 domain-containing protein [Candidatus Velthaea sp.]